MTSTQVNRPTDVRQKEADINQKLQLYGIFNGASSEISAVNRLHPEAAPPVVVSPTPFWQLILTSSPRQLLQTARFHQ